jgi:hypothetical protein
MTEIWVLLTSQMEQHKPTKCATTACVAEEPFLVPVGLHNFEEADMSEVPWHRSVQQTSDCTYQYHYWLSTKGPYITKTVVCELTTYFCTIQGHQFIYHCNLLNEFSSLRGHATNLNHHKLDPSVQSLVVRLFLTIFKHLNKCITSVCDECRVHGLPGFPQI